MIGHLPKRPAGKSQSAVFWQWVYDTLTGSTQPQAGRNAKVTRTTRGWRIVDSGKK